MPGTEAVLDAGRVHALFGECLAPDGEGTTVTGIVSTAAFIPGKLEARRPEIMALLLELPPQFMKSQGGGWSFLNACNDRHGNQWTGLHKTMEELFLLGLALGTVTCLLPRDMWAALPGGMPYYMIDDDGQG